MNPYLIGHGPTSGPIFVAEWALAGAVVLAYLPGVADQTVACEVQAKVSHHPPEPPEGRE